MSKHWTHKVVKTASGDFDWPTAATFDTEAGAIAYAERFAAEQAADGLRHKNYEVRTRKSFIRNGLKVNTVATVKLGADGVPRLVRW